MEDFRKINGRLIGQGKFAGYAITNTKHGRVLDLRGVPTLAAIQGAPHSVLELTKGIALPVQDPWVIWVRGKPCKLRNGGSPGIEVTRIGTSPETAIGNVGECMGAYVYRTPSTASKPVEPGQRLKIVRPGVVQAMRVRKSIATGATMGAPADWYCTCAPYAIVRAPVQTTPACEGCGAALRRVEIVRVLVPKHWCGPSSKMPERRAHLGETLARATPDETRNTTAKSEGHTKALIAFIEGNDICNATLTDICALHPCPLSTEIMGMAGSLVWRMPDALAEAIGELVAEHTVLADQLP